MKKIIYILSAIACTVFASCESEPETWNSNTYDYDGRYSVATTCEEYSNDDTSIQEGVEALIYNTSSNTANEIWIESTVATLPWRSKFKLTGNPSDFSCADTVENVKSETYLIDTEDGLVLFTPENEDDFRVPTEAGQLNDGVQLYTRVTLLGGNILSKSATSIGGNVVDSVYLRLVMHHDYMQFESEEKPQLEWADPNIPEYEWVVKAGSNTPADEDGWDEHWTYSGYRYSGFPEDH